MAAVLGGAADVVDRARCRGDPLGELARVVERRFDQSGDGSGRSERGPHLTTLAIDGEREGADGDHHRVARSDLHEGLARAARLDQDCDDELVLGERVPLDADEELGERDRPRPADARDLDLRALDEQRRQRVSRRRRGAEVAADRAAVADLRRAHRARGLGERRQLVRERPRHGLGVREPGSEAKRSVVTRPRAELGHLVEVEQRVGPQAIEVQGNHDVGAALDRDGAGKLRLERECFVERARREDVHPLVLPLLAHVRDAESGRSAEAALRGTGRDGDEHDDRHHVRERVEDLGRNAAEPPASLQEERQRGEAPKR